MRVKGAGSAVLLCMTFGVACSSGPIGLTSSPSASPIDAEKLGVSAYLTTIAAGTSKVTVVISFGGVGSPTGLKAAGIFNYKVGTGLLTFTPKGIPSDGYEVRFVRGDAYMRVPSPYSRVPGIKDWIRLDLRALARAGYFGKIGSGSGQSPGSGLAFLRGANSVERIGPETVGSNQTTRYKITVDVLKARDASPPDIGAASMLKVLAEAAITDLVIDLWIDPAGRARKVLYAIDLAKLGSADASPAADPDLLTMEVEYFDFGIPVNVETPPADQTGTYPP